MSQILKDIVTWLKQWFYTEDEVDTIVARVDGDIGDVDSRINNLEYSQIGGTFVDVTTGIQAVGLSEILNQIVQVLGSITSPNRWTTVSIGVSYATLYVNTSIKMCELRYVRSFSSASADTFYSWHSGVIPSAYRPSSQVGGAFNQVGTLYVDSAGNIGGKFGVSWSSSRSAIGTCIWHY